MNFQSLQFQDGFLWYLATIQRVVQESTEESIP